ncbi:MAG TPA: FHA domain-containing protein [Ktedonobacterales bacterium]
MAACQHCGREPHERDQFCQYCGHRLNADSAVPSQPALVASAVGASPDGAHAEGLGGGGAHPTPALWHEGDGVPGADGAQPVSAPTPVPVPPSVDDVSPAADVGNISDLDTLPVPDPQLEEPESKSRLLIRKAASERDPEREEVLGGRDIAIGRSPSCDIVLEGDELASRRHALIRARGGHYTVVDLGSSNGTYINGYEIRGESELRDGDRIAIGSHELIFAVGTPGPNASLAGERATNLPPRPAAATLRPTAMEGEEVAVATEDGTAADTDAEQSAQAGEGTEGDGAPSGSDGSAAPVSRAESKTAPLSAATPEELEALRLQIADIAGALARKADTESRAAQHYHDALAEARDRLDALLQDIQAHQEQDAQEREQRSELAQMAREAADHPRHLDYLSKLAENAGAIADSLGTEPSGTDLLDALRELLAHVNESLD